MMASEPPARRSRVASLAAAALVLLAAAVCVRFGFWQLDRLDQRRAQNAAVAVALDQPVLVLDAALAAEISRDPEAYRFRRIVLRGHYAIASDVILRGRSHAGQPGVHLFSTLSLPGSEAAVMVNRGWVPAADAATVDPRRFAEPGAREIQGIVLPYPPAQGKGVPAEQELGDLRVLSLSRLDRQALQSRAGPSLATFYVQELPASSVAAGPPIRLGVPPVDEGPHLGYAVQWFGFAAVFLVGLGAVAVGGRRRGRG